MNTSGARRVWCDERSLWIELDDGRTFDVALTRYPRLLAATPEQRAKVWIGYEGQGLHWEEIDEDVSVQLLLRLRAEADEAPLAAE